MRILTVFGTRPEAIKMAPVVKALSQSGTDAESRVCVTAQHREMLDQVLALFGIVPHWDLDLMQPEQDLTEVTGRMLAGVQKVLRDWRPDVVLVHGDTTTTFAASLAAYYERIAVGHVEAGLRTGNRYAPWPEEINRRLTSVLATYHFAPTEAARQNLLAEGIAADRIWITGNPLIDALLETVARIRGDRSVRAALAENFAFLDATKKLIVVTGHRRESVGAGMEAICRAIRRLAGRPDTQVAFSVHPSPSIQQSVHSVLGGMPRVHLLEPLDYQSFVGLLDRACLVITDSGGIQEEAPLLGKPVLVTRSTTERPEGVSVGTVRLVGTDEDLIVREAERLLGDPSYYAAAARVHSPFGDGRAAKRIVQALLHTPAKPPTPAAYAELPDHETA